MPLSEKLQKFVRAHEEYFSSANAISLLKAMSQSPAVYVDASSTEATGPKPVEKTQATIKVTDNRCKLDEQTPKSNTKPTLNGRNAKQVARFF